MKICFTFCLFLIAASGLSAQSLDIFPENILFQKYYADALSHQFSLSRNFENREWYGNVGAVIPVFDIKYERHLLQVSAASTIFNTIIKTPGHMQVYTVDYLVDFFFDYNILTQMPVRFIFGHLSAHYSDDGIIQMMNYPVNYARDYVGLHLQYKFNGAKIYAGYYHNFHIEPAVDKKNTFQLGGDKFFNVYSFIDIYAAVDFKIKSETDYTPTQSYQAGIRILPGKFRALRAAYTFRNGYEERGQLYNKKDSKHTFGLFLDF